MIVGAGFAGLCALHHARAIGLSARLIEAGSGVGGTWYWNRYPGARCDIESLQYSYQFSDELQQEWEWSERYAAQAEILSYLEHVADRFDLREQIQLDTRVVSAHFQEDQERWLIRTDNNDTLNARFCIMATGCLSSTNRPRFEGEADFEGNVFHTGEWPHEPVDFTGKRVGVIGTGSSAIQSIPIIAEQAEQVYVFQRTPNYSIPAHNRPLDPAEQKQVKAEYSALRERASQGFGGSDFLAINALGSEASAAEREAEFEHRWALGGLYILGTYADLMIDKEVNEQAAEFARKRIRAVVEDPETAEKLCPDQVIGCKRITVDTGYFETYNRPNVTLVDVSTSPIEEFTATGLRTGGEDFIVDTIVLATGFDAMTGSLFKIDIRGRGGERLKDQWAAGPKTYLGLMSNGFPNLFFVSGPGSPSVLSNMVVTIEQHVDWITDCLKHLQTEQIDTIEPKSDAVDRWVAEVNAIAAETLFMGCNSWYLGANVPGKPRIFMPYAGGFPAYRETCDEIAANGYTGFSLTNKNTTESEL